ncbi:MAG: group I truncated hemoglobin [Candidatus Xenobia bacterium]
MGSRRLLAVALLCAALTGASFAQSYSGKSIYDRLGGDAGMRNIVDDWYSRLVADPVLADRFNGPDRQELKTRYLKFLESFAGGPIPYRGPDLYSVHRHLRITQDEWTRTLQHMHEALLRYHIPELTAQEFLNKLGGLHNQIVYARTAPTPPAANTLYQKLGGQSGLTAIVNDFFDRLVNDPSMQDRWTGVDVPTIKLEVVKYLGQKTGGPEVYRGQDMRSIHYRMHITGEEWDTTVQHLKEALVRQNVPDDAAAQLLQMISSWRPQFVHDAAPAPQQ